LDYRRRKPVVTIISRQKREGIKVWLGKQCIGRVKLPVKGNELTRKTLVILA